MAAHIDLVVRNRHGLLGMLRRAALYLPPALLTLAYTSLIRSYLEYNSATFATAAPTHLKKLDVTQNRIPCRNQLTFSNPLCSPSDLAGSRCSGTQKDKSRGELSGEDSLGKNSSVLH